jgi:hypothetical protein
MRRVPRQVLPGLVLALCTVLGTSACSDDSSGAGPSAPPLPTGEPEAFEIRTVTTWGAVEGRLPADQRRRTERAVTRLVQGWFDAAYVGGDWPRSDFRDAFPGFTAGARDQARRDADLMTNRSLGPEVTDVTPTASRIRLDALAVRNRAVGATARFVLGFRTEGDRPREVRVEGRLLLSRQPAGWRIFGFDVARGGDTT